MVTPAAPPGGRILVTGALGYSGRAAVEALVAAGWDVRAADVAPRPAPPLPTPHYVPMDVRDDAQVRAAVAGMQAVMHFAACVPFGLSHSVCDADLFAVNVTGTARLLAAAKDAGVRHFIFASSTGVVFQGRDVQGGDEVSPPVPKSGWNDPYSASKAAAESLVSSASDPHSMACVSIRPNGIWGPGERHHLPKLLTNVKMGASAVSFGAHALTDFTHRANLVHACMCALRALSSNAATRARVSGKAYFVTDGWACHTLEFFSPLMQQLGFTPAFPVAVVRRGTSVGGTWSAKTTCSAPASVFAQLARLPQCSLDDPQAVIVTGPATLPLPGWLLYPVAALCTGAAKLLRPLVDMEPFLTRADVRKVICHNYYKSDAARRDLEYAPVVTTEAGMAELVRYYREAGYDGRVRSPSAFVVTTVLAGMLALGLLTYNVQGCADAARAALPVSVHAPLMSYAHAAYAMLAPVPATATGRAADAVVVAHFLWVVFWSAVSAHVLQGAWVAVQAYRGNKAPLPWALQTAALGMSSTGRLVTALGRDASAVPLLCMLSFLGCMPLFLALPHLFA